MEGLKTNSTALAALAEYTELCFYFPKCDIRSCLNTLQFLNKKNQTLNVVRNDAAVVFYHLAFSLGLPEWSNPFHRKKPMMCQKDMSRSIFDIWKEIFQNRKMKRAKRSDNCCNGMSNGFNKTKA
ncbi:hypothetical protein CK203_104203 [Vitis vinifera]|uniref:Uncharacterized protein n=1 Tax=Vitis vinifera TaxID=29760 RepID=A0A438BMY3_VITVI|nr:hypothetical protein CK203_104203 [Vitis vinifera]